MSALQCGASDGEALGEREGLGEGEHKSVCKYEGEGCGESGLEEVLTVEEKRGAPEAGDRP